MRDSSFERRRFVVTGGIHTGPDQRQADSARQEARGLAESAYTLRADVLEKLLKRCTSVKTVRLCLRFGRELSLPWAAKLTPARLRTGSNRAWVSRSKDGLLVLKP